MRASQDEIDSIVVPMLHAARVPGAAVAVVLNDGTLLANGYGYRDLEARLPVTAQTVYPIASTTKALNATLLGTLVDEGKLAWDRPVRDYLPHIVFDDAQVSACVTLRDLIIMRSGLPRHDWVWLDRLLTRDDLVNALRHLEMSAGFREKFQYNNLTVTVSGRVAEVVADSSWEDLVTERILAPLGMSETTFERPGAGNFTHAYHENSRRELLRTRPIQGSATAPSGGAMHSTVVDMTRWISFNLGDGRVRGRRLIERETLAEIHSPQIVVGKDPSAPSAGATYAMGWFADTYNSCARLSHGGLHNGVNSNVMMFPEQGIGLVSFTNFAGPRIASLINEHIFDLLAGYKSEQATEEALSIYEEKVKFTRAQNESGQRAIGTMPSHSLNDYGGCYSHPAYGRVQIHSHDDNLSFSRGTLVLSLEHWHYEIWTFAERDLFEIHTPHVFGRTGRLIFETDERGRVAAVSIRLESAVSPIRFAREEGEGRSSGQTRP